MKNQGGDKKSDPTTSNDPFAKVATEPVKQPNETVKPEPSVAPINAAKMKASTDLAAIRENQNQSKTVRENSADSGSDQEDTNSVREGDENLVLPNIEPIRWTASENIDHQRGAGWYWIVAILTVIVVGLGVWIRQWTLVGLAVIVLVAVLVVTRRPAREVSYELNGEGLVVGGQLKPFINFRAFGVRHDGALWQLVLSPAKRFGAETTIFFHEDQGEAIVDFLGARLPMEDTGISVIDHLSRRLKL